MTKINAYGYSKSLHYFKTLARLGFDFPDNYVLNLSSGGKYTSLYSDMKKLPITRGEFIAVKTPKKSSAVTRTRDEKRFLYQWAKANGYKKSFVCPGNCGSCVISQKMVKNIHACGNIGLFGDRAILIPIHN